SITRGEGGQNLVGSEQGTELGIIRTQELLAARRIDGAEQFFTRAIDFGFSKSSEEALRLWNKDSVLKDVVWVIRKYRPDIIITRFAPTQGGHGHHTASAILAQEAFAVSGDPNIFPEQLKNVQPWKAKRLLFNHFRFGGTNSNSTNIQTIKIDVGEFSPLLGKSFNEIAGISRTMHKSQGMGSSQNRGSNINEFVVSAGESAKNELFEGIDISWNRIPNGKKIAQSITEVQNKFVPQHAEKSIPALLKLYRSLQKINNDPLIDRKMDEIESIIQSCAGLWMEAKTKEMVYSPGDSIVITLSMLNRSNAKIVFASAFSEKLNINNTVQQPLKNNELLQLQLASIIPANERYSQPYFLASSPKNNRYSSSDDVLIGSPESPAPLSIAVSIIIENEPMMITLPIQYKWVDDLEGEKIKNIDILPPVSIGLEEKNIVVFSDSISKSVHVKVRAIDNAINGKVQLLLPTGWGCNPTKQMVSLKRKGDETVLQFFVWSTKQSKSGTFGANIEVDGKTYSSEQKTISYPHIIPQTVLENAEGKLIKFDLQTKGKLIGYIMGAGDQVPNALQQMGYTVQLISDDDLRNGNFTRFDAIVAGIRSYNTREQLRTSNNSLLQYVEQGGTYIVQYQTAAKGETDNIAPYRLELSRERVTNENAEMSCVKPDHALLNYPNIISAKDFEGWVQERGLYFASLWDDKYEKVFSCADPNEKSLQGSLLIAKYGKGNYIFTGLAFFRQLPAGVEGAYRLFANLLSVGK
ncbi:MAG TPA: LmbE family protein, partial [Bacteroidetes bacterium]|nr:LmbE family protein [Bacteroidota bacterium]